MHSAREGTSLRYGYSPRTPAPWSNCYRNIFVKTTACAVYGTTYLLSRRFFNLLASLQLSRHYILSILKCSSQFSCSQTQLASFEKFANSWLTPAKTWEKNVPASTIYTPNAVVEWGSDKTNTQGGAVVKCASAVYLCRWHTPNAVVELLPHRHCVGANLTAP